MAFGSSDYLYCSHSACRRRFYSERALATHNGSFHGRPTCETCGKKLKKSGQVSIPIPLTSPSSSNPTDLSTDSIRARCWIQVLPSRTTPHSTLFPTPTTWTMAMIPRMLRCVSSSPLRLHERHAHQADSMLISSPHPHSLPRSSRGLALILLPTTLMVSIGLNSVLPHWGPSTMTTTTRAAALRRSRMT